MNNVEKLQPTGIFTNYIYKAIPLAFDESMSYYEILCGLLSYLKDTVIPTVNNNADVIIELENYVNNYFDNLNVQNEINNKLDEMVENGTMGQLIHDYVQPTLDLQNEHINEIETDMNNFKNNVNDEISSFETDVNNTIDTQNNKINTLINASPIPVSSTADMTDETKVYVNTTNGYWYYFDGENWTQAGLYMSNSGLDQINDLTLYNIEFTNDYYINNLGGLSANSNYKISNYIPVYNNGLVFSLKFHSKVFKNTYAAAYDDNKNLIEVIQLSTSDALEEVSLSVFNKDYRFIRFSSAKNFDGCYAYYDKINKLSIEKIKNNMISDNSISYDKTNFLIANPYHNMIDFTKLTNGYINNNGDITSDNSLNVTDYIYIDENITYKWYLLIPQYYAFYDENYNFISGQSTLGNLTSGTFTPPENARYFRGTLHNNSINAAYVSLSNLQPLKYTLDINPLLVKNDYCDYNGNEIRVFNKILCIGDSLTYGGFNTNTTSYANPNYGYPNYLHKYTGVETTNKGDSGKSIEGWWNAHQNDDLSGYDCCIIELGTNNNSWGDTQITALTNIVNKVRQANKNIFVFISSTIPATSYQHAWYEQINEGLANFVSSINNPHVIFVDLQTYGHTLQNEVYNGGHLTAMGYLRLAIDYANFISFHIMTNLHQFKKVQFIGTDFDFNY